MEKEKVAIPEDVVNPKEYAKYLALSKHPLLRNTIITTSEGDNVNIAMLPHRLRKSIENLSPKEQDDIMEIKRKWNVVRAKASIAKALAYGNAGCMGGRKREGSKKFVITPFEEDIIELLGRLFTTTEVIRIMGEDNGIDISVDDVKGVMRKHIVEIEKKREEFRNRIADVRLYNKRPRLEELAWMYSRMKMRYVSFNSIDAYNSMLRTLEQIRKESEGDILNIHGALDVNIEVKIQNQIQQEILRTVNLKEIIIGRVAARMKMDPNKLIAGLHNSYYAKFVDISNEYDESADMNYPSTSAYDFSKIERDGESNVIDVTPVEETQVEKTTAVNVRDIFLAKIRKQKALVETKQNIFDVEAERNQPTAVDEEKLPKKDRSWHDEILPSKSKSKYKINKNYKTGEKI